MLLKNASDQTRVTQRKELFSKLLVLLCCSMIFHSNSKAQNIDYTENLPDRALRSDVKIDPSTLALHLHVPLSSYAGRGGSNLEVALNYSSKMWGINYFDTKTDIYDRRLYDMLDAAYGQHSVRGWTSSLGVPHIEWTSSAEVFKSTGTAGNCGHPWPTYTPCYRISRLHVYLADGSAHEMRKDDMARQTIDNNGIYYSTDSMRMIFQTATNTLFMSDGSRYIFSPVVYGQQNATQYIDRHGNTQTYNSSTRQWADNMGRIISEPLPVNPAPGGGDNYQYLANNPNAGDYDYYMPGINGTSIHYVLRYRSLDSVRTDPAQPLQYRGDFNLAYGNAHLPTPNLFTSSSNMRITVEAQLFNPVVLNEIVLPNNTSYRFTYNVYGEIDKVVFPTGGYERYRYEEIPSTSSITYAPYRLGNRAVVERWVSANGTGSDEVHWQYAAGFLNGYVDSSSPYIVRVTAPDGTRTDRYIHTNLGAIKFGFNNARSGLVYDERVYKAGGAMVRRMLTEWSVSGPTPGGDSSATRDPRITTAVKILLDTSGDALAATTMFVHDSDLNAVSTSQYGYITVDQFTAQNSSIGAMPRGPLMNTIEVTYLVNDASIEAGTRASYRDRNLLALPTVTRTRDAAGAVVAQSEVRYDEMSYPVLTYGPITGWVDPATAARGNPTTIRRWLDTAATFLEAHAQYDQGGGMRNSWDALGNLSQLEYSSTYAYAYPTRTTTPIPDPTGTLASSASFSVINLYDSSTGLVTATTDANNQTISYEYNDALNRLTRITRPVGGGWIIYEYDDTPGSVKIHSRTLQQNTPVQQEIEEYRYFDGIGRPSRIFRKVDATTYSVIDTQYDSVGHLRRLSNPYFSALGGAVNPSGNWTTNTYDELGRSKSQTTADSAQIVTFYSGNLTTVTDQMGKIRCSVADALDRMVQVIEDPSGLAYQTEYTYDALNNLRMVVQGSQRRYFMFDSLSRVIRAKNPEQLANPSLTGVDPVTGNSQWSIFFSYDSNGNLAAKTDARGLSSTYSYDALNRNTRTDYSDTPSNPDVERHYDGATNGRARFWYDYAWSQGNAQIEHAAIDSYDAVGRPLNYRRHFFNSGAWSGEYTIGRTYDLAGHVRTQTYPSGRTVSYAYDNGGRVSDVSGNLSDGVTRTYSTSIQYNEASKLKQEQFGTDIPLYNKMFYNVRCQLSEIRLGTTPNDTGWDRGTVINHFSFQSWAGSGTDNNGNLKKSEHYIPRNDGSGYDVYQGYYDYDGVNRLQAVREGVNGGPATWQQSYTYDQFGNRSINENASWGLPWTQFVLESATNHLYATNDPNRTLMAYDAAGNLINDSYTGNGSRSYDAQNRITAAVNTSSQWSYYTYDADGRRVRRNTLGQETWQIYGIDNELVAEYGAGASASTPQKEYAYRNEQLLLVAAGGTNLQWLVVDHLGTPRMIIDKPGSLTGVKRHDYMPFGQELLIGVNGRTTQQGFGISDGVRQKFTQQERDSETGMDFFKARYYSSSQGRFTSIDPGPFTPADPQNWNRYAYVQNNPLKFFDPSGKILVITGADADYIVGELERLTGLKLKRDPATGIVTIDTGVERNKSGTSKLLADKLSEVIGDQSVTAKINTIRDADDPRVFFDSFPKRALDVSDYNVAKRDDPGFAARLLGHVLEEYYQAEKKYAKLDETSQRRSAHEDAKVFESKMVSEITGQAEQTRTNIETGPVTLRYVYTTVTYDVTVKSARGTPGYNTVVSVTKNEVQKPKSQ